MVVSQELQDRAADGRGGAVTCGQAAGDLCGSLSRPAAAAAAARSSTAVVVDADATQTDQNTALCSSTPHGDGNDTTRAGFGLRGRAGSATVSQGDGDVEGEGRGGGGGKEPDWSLAATQQQSLLPPRTSPPPARDKLADGARSERSGVGGGGSPSSATDLGDAQGSEAFGTPTGDGQPRWTWEQMGAQDQYLDLSLDRSVEVNDEKEEQGSMDGGSGKRGGTEERSDAGDAHAPSVSER